MRRTIGILFAATGMAAAIGARPLPAQDASRLAPGAPAALPAVPDWLPHYHLAVDLDTASGKAAVRQTVRWTNPGPKPADELWFHVYPNHRIAEADLVLYERTLESLRVDPRTALDRQGRRLRIDAITSGTAALPFAFDARQDTLLKVQLPQALPPGQTVEVVLAYELDIPPVQGRLGTFRGVTNLANWYPMVAYYGPAGWDAPPYVAWHQPWLNEAGHYTVELLLQRSEQVAASGRIVDQRSEPDGRQRLTITGSGLRDFALVVSKRFETHEALAAGVRVRVLSFPEHRYYARLALQTAVECIELYGRWFGPYAYSDFTIAEAYFGWNGNETAGMVLIDERVFDAPQLGHLYIEHLISHEICHQWWFAAVGTDGYRETWMDEGLVSYFTERRMQEKYGRRIDLLDWPRPLGWLPNVRYTTLVHSGYLLYDQRGGKGRVLAPLPEIGHIHNLFFLVYDKGGKVTGMLHERLGDERFCAFLRHVYRRYCYRVLLVADFQRELEAFTGQSWQSFFDDWLRSPKTCDWSVRRVSVRREDDSFVTTVKVRQNDQIAEPVEVAHFGKGDAPPGGRILLLPDSDGYAVGNASVTRIGPKDWQVEFRTAEPPEQVVLDPDSKVLDVNRRNNRWRWQPEWRFTPLYTPVDEVPLVRPIDRPSIVIGPNIDQEGRLGLRGSFMDGQRYRISPFLAYTATDDHLTAGVDSLLFNVPAPDFSLGARYEHTLATDFYDDPYDQAKLYLRWNQLYTTSFIYQNLAYLEFYFRVGDNFFPDEDLRPPARPDVEDYRDLRAVGISYNLNTQMPYWNPEKGFHLEATFEHGFQAFGSGESYNRISSQLAAVRRLPDGLGWFSDSRVAGRVAGGAGAPDNGEHFRFGGPARFRGQRSEDTEGSLFWLATAEWRFPIRREMNINLYDNVGNWHALYGAIFYDVGESYLLGDSQGIDHALGIGFYFHIKLLSFLEELTIRTEYGRSLRRDTDVLWFGIYHAY